LTEYPDNLDSPVLEPPSSREKILEVAEALFAANGYSGVGMRQIASAVELGKSSLFHHFPSKLDLYGEVLDRVLERLEVALGEDDEVRGRVTERLEHWIESAVATMAEDPPAARLLLRSLVDEEPFPPLELAPAGREALPFERRLDRVINRFRALLEEGISEGVFRTVSIGDAIQTVIGVIVFHFASGDLGETLIGEEIFSGVAVERRRREVSEFIRRGLMA